MIDSWNKIEDPDTTPPNYSHLIFDKDAKNTHWRKKKQQHLQQMVLGKLNVYM